MVITFWWSPIIDEQFSTGTPTNKTDHHDISEIFLNVTLNIHNYNPPFCILQSKARKRRV
jgi:hypothetical protein